MSHENGFSLVSSLSYIRRDWLGAMGRLLNGCGDGVGDAPGGQRIDCSIRTRETFGEPPPSSSLWQLCRPPYLGKLGFQGEHKRGKDLRPSGTERGKKRTVGFGADEGRSGHVSDGLFRGVDEYKLIYFLFGETIQMIHTLESGFERDLSQAWPNDLDPTCKSPLVRRGRVGSRNFFQLESTCRQIGGLQ